MFSNPVFSNPVLSKVDAAIIAILLCSGTATLIESRHRVLIVAPMETQAEAEALSSVAESYSKTVIGPTGEPMIAPDGATTFEPTFAAHYDTARSSG